MNTRCGFIAIIGRPNVGKSTLINKIVGQKVTVTANKPQTTRQQILAIKTEGDVQMVFIDTPGIHRTEKKLINKSMNKAARSALQDVDLLVWVLEAGKWTDEDEYVQQLVAQTTVSRIIAVNKIDSLPGREALLPYIQSIQEKLDFDYELLPISAFEGDGVSQLLGEMEKHMPESTFYFPADQISNTSDQFLITEVIREKIIQSTDKEIPYSSNVELEAYEEDEKLLKIGAVIWVERSSQKGIVIGKKGAMLKHIGSLARQDLERIFARKVFLKLWVRVKESWSDDARSLKGFGLLDD